MYARARMRSYQLQPKTFCLALPQSQDESKELFTKELEKNQAISNEITTRRAELSSKLKDIGKGVQDRVTVIQKMASNEMSDRLQGLAKPLLEE